MVSDGFNSRMNVPVNVLIKICIMKPVVLVVVVLIVVSMCMFRSFFCSLTDEAETTSSASVLVNARPACFVKIILLIPLFSLCEGDHEVDQTS